MPILLIIFVLAILIAAFGFWDALTAVLGATLLAGLLMVLAGAALGLAGYLLVRRSARG